MLNAVQHYMDMLRSKGLNAYNFPTARSFADIDPDLRSRFDRGEVFVRRQEHSDFEMFRQEVGYPLPEDIAQLLNAYWQPGIFGYYKDFPECFILFPALRSRDGGPDDFLKRPGGLISEAERWISYDGDPKKYLPIGIYDPYSCDFLLYELATGKILIENCDDEGNPDFIPAADSLRELIAGLYLRSSTENEPKGGSAVSNEDDPYTKEQVIGFLENRRYDKFDFTETDAYIYTKDFVLVIEAPGGKITEDTAQFSVKLLTELDQCIKSAQPWLKHFNLRGDRWYPDALDKGFEVVSVYIGQYISGGTPRPPEDGFMITFDAVNSYPCGFTVKFHRNMWPYAVEEFVE